MKKTRVFALIMAICIALSLFTACDIPTNNGETSNNGGIVESKPGNEPGTGIPQTTEGNDEAEMDFEELYPTPQAVFLELSNRGYEGTFEEWVESLRGADGKDGENGKSAYELAVEMGYEGTLEEWLISLIGVTGAQGEKGDKGDPGETGAQGEQGEQGIQGEKGDQGEQGIQGEKGDTGEAGQDGKTPYIGENGNWWIGDIDTGILADYSHVTKGEQGIQGEKGEQGEQGIQGEKGDQGEQGIQGEKGDQGEQGIQGEKGDKGDQGDTGATIDKVEFDEQGRLVITLTDGTVLDPVELPKEEEHVHTFGERVAFGGNASLSCEDRLYFLICSDCGYTALELGTPSDHDYGTEYSYDGTTHYYACSKCSTRIGVEEHDDPKFCEACGYSAGTKGLVYELSNDGSYYTVVRYDGTTRDIVIPPKYNGIPVKAIGSNIFGTQNGETTISRRITTIYICKGIETIGSSAFSYCSNLTSITIPDSITSIGYYAFDYCTSLESITIPDSVTSIGYDAFRACTKLIQVENGVSYVDKWVVDIDSSAESITLRDDTVGFADNVMGMLPHNEYGNAIYIGTESNPYLVLLKAKDTSITSVEIPNSTRYIEDNAFYYCSNLTSITIPDSVTSIGTGAFNACGSLESITIGKGVVSIGEWPLYNCLNLKNIFVDPDNKYYQSIDGNLYSKDGKQLIQYATGKADKSFTISATVVYIDSDAFSGCQNLENIFVDVNNEYLKSIDGNLYSKDGKRLIQYATGKTDTSFTIPNDVTYISEYAFDGSSLTSITIPDSVTSIGDVAFSGCSSLTSITIPDSVIIIGDFAFRNCSRLETVYYTGTEEEWAAIYIDSGNYELTNVNIIYNYVPEE